MLLVRKLQKLLKLWYTSSRH